MLKKLTINIKKLFAVIIAIVLCFENLACACPKSVPPGGEGVTFVVRSKGKEITENENTDAIMKEVLDNGKSENKNEKSQVGEKWRKFGQFVGRRFFYFLFGMIAPSFNLCQSDLDYAISLAVGYIVWKLSGEVCSLVGLKDKKTHKYTSKSIGKKAANLLIRHGSMVLMNNVVPKNIIHDSIIDYVYESVDSFFDDMTFQDKQNLKQKMSQGINFCEEGIRYGCFSYVAKLIPKIVGF